VSEYLDKVINASGGHAAPAENLEAGKKEAPEGYHYMPDGTLMKDSEHEDEAALEKNADDPCWEGYVQVGMKKGKGGDMVPNCVPMDASIVSRETAEYVVSQINSNYGPSRHIDLENIPALIATASSKHETLSGERKYNATLWEIMSVAEYATTGELPADVPISCGCYSSYLPEGHPDTESTLVASARWVAGASDLEESSRDAVISAFAVEANEVESMHANARLTAIMASGSLSEKTLNQIKSLSEASQKSDTDN
jgi:hypothetical protein